MLQVSSELYIFIAMYVTRAMHISLEFYREETFRYAIYGHSKIISIVSLQYKLFLGTHVNYFIVDKNNVLSKTFNLDIGCVISIWHLCASLCVYVYTVHSTRCQWDRSMLLWQMSLLISPKWRENI